MVLRPNLLLGLFLGQYLAQNTHAPSYVALHREVLVSEPGCLMASCCWCSSFPSLAPYSQHYYSSASHVSW